MPNDPRNPYTKTSRLDDCTILNVALRIMFNMDNGIPGNN